jgi:hypothetical protein
MPAWLSERQGLLHGTTTNRADVASGAATIEPAGERYRWLAAFTRRALLSRRCVLTEATETELARVASRRTRG